MEVVQISRTKFFLIILLIVAIATSGCGIFFPDFDDIENGDPGGIENGDPDEDRNNGEKDPSSHAQEALNLALTQLGRPYQWGSRGPNSFDCSGLIVWAYRNTIPGLMFQYDRYLVPDANMDSLWRYNVKRLSLGEIQPGDIIFITSSTSRVTHGGMFIRWLSVNEMEIVHSSSAMGGVVIEAWPVRGLKRGQWFHGAGQLIVRTSTAHWWFW